MVNFKPFIPTLPQGLTPENAGIYDLLAIVTGWAFAFGIAAFIVAILLSAVLFAVSGANLLVVERSRLWLVFAFVVLILTAFPWALFNIVLKIYV